MNKGYKEKKLVVLGLATEDNWQAKNWKNAILKNGGEPHLLGLGEKWEGWSWRVRHFLNFLQNLDDDEIVLVTDVYDSYIIKNVDIVKEEFLKYGANIVISSERCYSLQGLEKLVDMKYHKYLQLLSQKIDIDKYDHLSLNAGQIIGYCKHLKELYQRMLEIMKKVLNDDQSSLYTIWFDWLENKIDSCPFVIDFDQRIFGTISNVEPFDQWVYQKEDNSYLALKTKSSPPCLHFPGKAMKYYTEIGEKIYKEEFINEYRESSSSNNNTALIVFIIFLIFLIIIAIVLEYQIDIKNY